MPPPAPPPAPTWQVGMQRWTRRMGVVIVAPVALAIVSLATAFVWSVPSPSPQARSVGVNALWARHSWAAEPHSAADLDLFAARLRSAQISDLFVHIGPLDGDGSLPPGGHPYAAPLVAGLHRRVPGLRVQAHLGQLLSVGGGPLRLHQRDVRDRIVTEAEGLLDLGFDGIHYGIEPVRSGDDNFLDLLRRTRLLTGARGAVLSVALEDLAVHPVVDRLVPFLGQPDSAYLDAVADRVDQIAVLTYDSGMPTAAAFAAWQAWQTVRVAGVVSDRVTLFMGVSTNPAGGPGHHPWAEAMGPALHGLRRGLDSLGPGRASRHPIGAGVFAEWTTSDQDWRRFRDEWVEPEP